ncbi:MAG: B12-binding domain-containing radical SAM protein [Methanomassiliicoccales archaeon]|nr:B12-binding domain-containing radical SAM protein [Methanomassiliicoccales archaeon]MDD1755424.1 B12-binding domain-containing radical SAM protein [Methanomassiliicoccales archaeon]
MRIVLIQPPMFHQKVHLAPNLGLAYIAAVLEKDGAEVKVIDAAADDLGFDQILDRVARARPDLVAAGGQTPVSSRSKTIFRRIKAEVGREVVTVAGGPHFTFTDLDSLQECPELDVVVRGEGEETMRQLCQALSSGKSLEEVEGITYRSIEGVAFRNPPRLPIANLDSLPFPAWHLFPVDRYHWAGNKMIAISSSRGCQFRCRHCITWKMHTGVRRRDPRKIVEEMVWVKRNFNHDTFFFQDDSSFTDRGQLVSFLEELEASGERLYWYYETREDIFQGYRDLWPRMKHDGLFKIVFGLETPDPAKRELYGKKGFDPPQVEAMMDQLERELDILVSVYLLFGLPEDTEESVQAILDYGKHIYPDHCSFIVGSLAVPFPGSDFYTELVDKEMLTSHDWDDYGFDKSVIKTSIPPEKLSEVFSAFWAGTYARPKVMLKQVQFLLSRNRFRRAMAKQYLKMAREMISDVRKMRKEEETGF